MPRSVHLRSALLTYEGLPGKWGGGHALRTRDIPGAWGQVLTFISDCAEKRGEPEGSYLLLAGDGVQRSFTIKNALRFTLLLGVPSVVLSSTGVGRHTVYRWRIPSRRLQHEAALFSLAKPLPPVSGMAPLALTITYHLHFKSPNTGRLLPFQDPRHYLDQVANHRQDLRLGQSLVHLTLSERPTLYAFLSLPFEALDQEARDFIAHLKSRFPTKMSPAGWRLWRLNKDASSYYQRALRNGDTT